MGIRQTALYSIRIGRVEMDCPFIANEAERVSIWPRVQMEPAATMVLLWGWSFFAYSRTSAATEEGST
jgi:hypothetical protein